MPNFYNFDRAIAALRDHLEIGANWRRLAIPVAIVLACGVVVPILLGGRFAELTSILVGVAIVLAVVIQPAAFVVRSLSLEGRRLAPGTTYRGTFGRTEFVVRSPSRMRLRVQYAGVTNMRIVSDFFIFAVEGTDRTLILPRQLLPGGDLEWLNARVDKVVRGNG